MAVTFYGQITDRLEQVLTGLHIGPGNRSRGLLPPTSSLLSACQCTTRKKHAAPAALPLPSGGGQGYKTGAPHIYMTKIILVTMSKKYYTLCAIKLPRQAASHGTTDLAVQGTATDYTRSASHLYRLCRALTRHTEPLVTNRRKN